MVGVKLSLLRRTHELFEHRISDCRVREISLRVCFGEVLNTGNIILSVLVIDITNQVIKLGSFNSFAFKNHLILLVLCDEVLVVLDDLQEQLEVLAAIGW